MAVSMRKQIAQNKRNTILLMLIFVVFITLIGWLFSWLYDNYSIMIWFLVISAGYALFQYFLADKIAIKTSGAREIQEDENPRYYQTIRKLTTSANLPMPKLYIINDDAPNAFATGRDPEHASVAATTGLFEIMDDRELAAVMGHELSHIKNFDIRINMIVFGLVSLVGLMSDFGMRVLLYDKRNEENNSPIGALFALITLVLSPIVASLVQMGVSRQREYLADASSATITGSTDDMIDALRKLETHSRPMHQQNVATESMYIANPLAKSMISRLFSTHPPLEARIERLENAKK
ncbi:MAG: M48 family metalloprotease [Candidatus Saccharibacteria bacterium]|nr:M48 family metalloprotease [Candidatus Saccharibacteria bacterium]